MYVGHAIYIVEFNRRIRAIFQLKIDLNPWTIIYTEIIQLYGVIAICAASYVNV